MREQKERFGAALIFSALLHTLFFGSMYALNLEVEPLAKVLEPPIVLSLPEEPQKEEAPKSLPKPKKIEKQKEKVQKIVQKQEEPKEAPIKNVAPEAINTPKTRQAEQKNEEPTKQNAKYTPPSSQNQNQDEIKKYLSTVRKKLQDSLEYPYFAKKAGMEGVVVVHFCIKEDGALFERSLKIIKSSGYSALDAQALQTVKNSAPFFAPPKGELELSIPVSFSLQS